MDVVITLSNGTVILQQAASAVDSANTRSLYGIIWSCLVTLFFCTWVAIHPNSADENETDGVVVVRRIGLMIAMFLVPEMVVCWALRQWVLATYLGKKYKGYPVGVKWRKVHGYFLIMGGFMYYDKDGKLQRLTSSKLKLLYNNGDIEWPTISAKQIRDRSKADVLSKLVVLVQTGWFSLQLLVRLGKGMVVTELEISTFAFAVVSLIVYILWWDKPFDVRSHVIVRGGKEPDITLKPIPVQPPTTRSVSSPSLDPAVPQEAGTPDYEEKVEHEQSTITILTNDLSQRLSNSGQRFSRKMKRAFRIITPCLPHTDPESQDEPKQHRKVNWHRYIAAKTKHIFTQLWKSRPHGFMDFLYFYPAFLYGCFISPFYNLYVEKGRTVEALSEKDPYESSVDPDARSRHPWAGFLFDSHVQLAVVSAVGVIFGSVHLIAWPFMFHTDAERWLWRASSLALIFPPILFQVYTFLFFLCRKKFPGVSSWVKDLLIIFWILTLLVAAVAYMIGRALLIVLPLMALRHAPKGAFVDIDWTSHFPHI